MSNKEDLLDALKPLHQVCEPDERQQSFLATLDERHKTLSEIVLNENVPVNVKQLFETAKNLSLYSWFVYRFHPVAELVSFSALEMALRERYLSEAKPTTKKPPHSIYDFLQHAKENNWICDTGFPSFWQHARNLAEQNKTLTMIHAHDFNKEPSMTTEELTKEEILTVMADMNLMEGFIKKSHKIRNDLAHGSSTLHPNSSSTLWLHAEAINQIYPL